MNNELAVTAPSIGMANTPRRRVSRVKAILVGMLVVGAATAYAGGTFANFTAEVDNPGTIQTGTLVLERPLQGSVTDCYSTSAGASSKVVTTTNLATCGSLFTTALTSAGGTASQNLTIINQGSITPTSGAFKLACANNSNPSNGFAGSADLCTIMSVVVAETTTAGGATLVASGSQLYGSCSTTATSSCTAAAGPSSTGSGATTALLAGQLTGTHYYLVKVVMASAPDNSYQGRAAGLTFNWTLTE